MTWELGMEVGQATTPGPTTPVFEDFLQTGRTGRRNAMPDILGANAAVGTGELPNTLQNLSCTDSCSQPSTSGQSSSTSQKT